MHYNQTIVSNLLRDFEFKQQGRFLVKGLCPSCNKRELYVCAEKPYYISCNRQNKCGYTDNTKELYPEIFTDLSKKHPPTTTDSLATAKVYLSQVRGFDINKIAGWFDQGKVWDAKTNIGTATVKFWLDANKTRYWERLIDNADKLGKKNHFGGKRKEDGSIYKGDVWQPPVKFDYTKPIWLVEGIFDAIALYHAGKQAVALFSCNNYPSNYLYSIKNKQPTLVFALDSDAAGVSNSKKFIKRAFAAGFNVFMASLPDTEQQLDWNDL